MKIKLYTNICICMTICLIMTGINMHPVTKQTIDYNQEAKLVILMYHGFTDKSSESEYVINASRLEEDIQYLKKEGFEFVDTRDLVDFVYSDKKLPQKSVMLTFDDGYYNNYTYAFPILKKYNVKAVISPIGYYVELYSLNGKTNNDYTQLRDIEIKEMYESGLVDFQNHSYNMHSLGERKGSSKKDLENDEEYIREFYYDLKKAENVIKSITGEKTDAYVYPFGNVSDESKTILKCMGYRLSFSCTEGFNTITKEPQSLYMLKRFNRTPQKNAAGIVSGY